jgi:hypothetical protein
VHLRSIYYSNSTSSSQHEHVYTYCPPAVMRLPMASTTMTMTNCPNHSRRKSDNVPQSPKASEIWGEICEQTKSTCLQLFANWSAVRQKLLPTRSTNTNLAPFDLDLSQALRLQFLQVAILQEPRNSFISEHMFAAVEAPQGLTRNQGRHITH